MKILMLTLSCIALLSTISCSKEVPWYNNPAEPFWQLKDPKVAVMDITLNPSESREIEIITNNNLMVGIKPKVTIAQYQEYTPQKPIKIQDLNSFASFSSLSSASFFKPNEGRIRISATNNADIALTFVVYKEEYGN